MDLFVCGHNWMKMAEFSNSWFSKFFPKNRHLRITMYSSAVVGAFPFVFGNYPKLKSLYKIYSNTVLGYFLFFIVTAYMQLFCLLRDTGSPVDEISGNLAITLIYTMCFIRQLICRTKVVKRILRNILDTEEHIYNVGDVEVIDIYGKCAHETRFYSKFYLIAIVIVTILYFIRPIFVDGYVREINNETFYIKPLLLSSWFPYNPQDHYMATYFWQLLDGLVGAWFVICTDIFTYSLIMYPSGQIKILSHILRNIDAYTEKLKRNEKLQTQDKADFKMMKEAIRMHKKLVGLVDDFNTAMSIIMLADFLQGSLQLASVLTQIVGAKISILMGAFVFCTFYSMFLRLVLYYYNANEIILESRALGDAIYESAWYEKSPQVKYMVLIFLIRTKKELALNIGPFATMSLGSFLSVLKGTYSYIMLMFGKG